MSASQLALASEADAGIGEALAEMDRIIANADHYGSAILEPMKVQRALAQAQYRMFVDGSLLFQKAVDSAKRPISDEDLAVLLKATTAAFKAGAQQFAYDTILAAAKRLILVASASAAGAAILLLAAGIGIGWYLWSPMHCEEQHGGLVCYFWAKPPTS